MHTSELRIGNLIYAGGQIAEVVSIESKKENDFVIRLPDGIVVHAATFEKDIKPIPLTPHILENRCGFNKNGKLIIGLHPYQYYLKFKDGHIIMLSIDGVPNIHFWDIKYLHQLQNLYFIFKGENICIQTTLQ